MNIKPHFKQGIWALFDKSLTGIYGFVFIFLVVAKLPKEQYGIYTIVFSVTSLALLFNKGLILYPMTKYEAEDSSKPLLLGNTFILSLATLISWGVLIYFMAPAAARLFHSTELTYLLRLVPVLLLSFFFRDFTLSYLLAHRQIKKLAVLDAIYFIGLAGGFAVMNFLGVLDTAMDALVLNIIFAGLSSIAAFFLVQGKIRMVLRLSKEECRKIFKFGRYSLSMGIGEIIFYQVDLLLLGRFFGPVEVAMYNSAKLSFRMFQLLSQSLSLIIYPGTSRMHFQKRIEDIRAMYAKVIAGYWSIILLLNIPLFIFADYLFELINYPESANILRIFLVFSFFEPLYTISMNVLYGMGKPAKAFKPLVAAIPVYIVLNLILIPHFKGLGAAFAFNFNNVLVGIFYLWTLKRVIGVRITDIFREMLSFPAQIVRVLKSRTGSE